MPRHGRGGEGRVLAGAVAAAALLLGAAPAHAAPQELTIAKPWIRFLTPGTPAAGYFTLHNAGSQPAALTGASSPACGELMLHESVVTHGMAQMDMTPSVAVPAHGSVQFRPGGYHLMCMHPAADMAPGGHVPVSLHFADGTSVSASFPVYGPKGK